MAQLGEDLFLICNQVIDSKVTPKDAVDHFKKLQEKDKSVASRLLDILVVSEIEAESAQQKEKFTELITLVKETLIPSDILTLEFESGQEVHKRALIRHKTRLYFKQSKFNLLREESEGYAKLVTELLEVGTNDVSPEGMKNRLLCLIGQFNLDPNRVYSLVLQCMERHLKHKDYFIALLKECKPSLEHLQGIVGFQYSFYQSEGKRTPFSLYGMTAALIQAEMIDLMKIIGCLSPKAETIKDSHKERVKNASKRAKKAETIITTEIAAESSRNNRNMDRDISDGQNVVGVSFATVAATQDAEDEKILGAFSEEITLSVNQKLGLVCALLEAGEWGYAQQLLDRMPGFYAVQSGPRICQAIAALIDDAIEDFYREKCGSRLFLTMPKTKELNKRGLPRVQNWEDLVEKIAPVLWYLGPRIGYNASTTTKLIRLITIFYEEKAKDPSTSDDKIANTMMDIVDECLLCSLSMQVNSPNVVLSEELWTLLQLFPYQQRYRLYGRWKFLHTVRHPELSVNRAKVLGRTKYILKRLSKETVKIMGRQLGKLCHVHPMTVIDYMLSMVQTFDNFIGPVVESLKFLTLLEFDILSFCLMEQLANPDRLQLKASDGNLSMWLQALGTMVGSIYKKYNVELAGILNYVANQLVNKKGFDLLILREIIQNMSSVESSINATEEQLEALTGGDVLKLEAGGFSNARNKRASNRLRDALLEDDLAEGLCILIAQQREFIIHHEYANLPLKLVGEMVDQCRDTLVQFGTFLMQSFKYEEYYKRIPSAAVLMEESGVPLDVAMFLTRPFFNHLINEYYIEQKKMRKSLDMVGDGVKKLDSTQKFLFFKSAMDDVVNKLVTELSTVKALQASKAVNLIGMKMIVTFWMLSSYDLEVPNGAYERAVDNIRRQMRDAENNPELSKNKRAKELERLVSLESRLKEEQRRQTEHVDRVRQWLSASQDQLFPEKGSISVPFLSTCVLKRALFSESDAIFCAKLILFLHAQKTTYFQTMIFFDKTFHDLLPFISGLTENEASSFGRFLDILLTQANKWNLNKDLYEKECYMYPGFYLKIGSDPVQKAISLESYKQLTYKWQTRTFKCFSTAMKNPKSEYVVIRNTFVILAKMIGSFPIVQEHYTAMEEVTMELQKREKGKRDDLALLASSYAARLKSVQKNIVDKAVYTPSSKAKKVIKPPANENGTATEKNEKKRVLDANTAPEPKKRPRTERMKENEETEKKTNGADKENNKAPTPSREESGIEEGEVSDTPPVKKTKTSVSQNGKEEKDNEKERGRERMERSGDKTPKSRRREEIPEKKERKEEHLERRERREENLEKKERRDDNLEKRERREDHIEKKDKREDNSEKKDRREENNHKDERHKEEKKEDKEKRREIEKREDKEHERRKEESKDIPKSITRRIAERPERRVERPSEEKREERRKEEKEEPKRRREKEEVTAGPAPPPKEERIEKDKKEDRKEEKKDIEKVHRRVEVKKEERHARIEKADHKEEKKEERPREKEVREERKEERHKDTKKDERGSERKRIVMDRPDKDEPGIKITRTSAGGKAVKVEAKASDVPIRKHREISPPRDISSRRLSSKDSRPSTFRR